MSITIIALRLSGAPPAGAGGLQVAGFEHAARVGTSFLQAFGNIEQATECIYEAGIN
jgi:hypothetical protein